MCRNDGARYAGGSVEPHEPLARGCVVCHHVQGLEPQLSPYICNDDDTDDGDDDDAAWTRLQVPHPSTPEPTSGAGTAAGSRAELLASLAVRGVLARALSLSILTRARALSLSLCLSHTQPKSIIRFHLEGLDAKFKTLLVSSNHTIEFIHNALAKKCLPQDTAGFGLCVVHLDEVLDDSAPRTLPLLSLSCAVSQVVPGVLWHTDRATHVHCEGDTHRANEQCRNGRQLDAAPPNLPRVPLRANENVFELYDTAKSQGHQVKFVFKLLPPPEVKYLPPSVRQYAARSRALSLSRTGALIRLSLVAAASKLVWRQLQPRLAAGKGRIRASVARTRDQYQSVVRHEGHEQGAASERLLLLCH